MSTHGKLNSDTLGVFEGYEYFLYVDGEYRLSQIDREFVGRIGARYVSEGHTIKIERRVYPTYRRRETTKP